jgi:diguanylate cyclase (GGDEF)-like protein
LDRFKSVNDAFGHHVGDQLLIQMANRVYRHLNERSKFLRIGGDEFLLIIENSTIAEAIEKAEDVLQQVQETYLIIGKEIMYRPVWGSRCILNMARIYKIY